MNIIWYVRADKKREGSMTRKRLNIKPYNEFWYQNCLMHALAQITGSLGIIDCLLFDCIFTYEFECKDGKLILIFMGMVNLKRVFYSQIEALRLEYNILNTKLLLKTINDWNILMGLFGKMVYSGSWSKKTLLNIVELFKFIYKTECLWFKDAKNDFLEVLA